MPANHVLLETIELTQTTASVTFDNIPQTGYTDLKIVVSARDSLAQIYGGCDMRFNGDSGTNYTRRNVNGNGSAVASASQTTTSINSVESVGASATANTFSNTEWYIPNYRSSNYKSVSVDQVTENNATTAYAKLTAGIWSNTAAITSITILPGTAFVAGSTFSLYGIAAFGTTPVLAPKATGGNIVANDGTYWYHAFLSSGTFTPLKALSCDYYVVGAGGGGGSGGYGANGGGGGGAGNYSTATATLTANAGLSVVVGAGGGGAVGGNGVSGSSSSFNSTTVNGGSFGVAGYAPDSFGGQGGAGGSGGGAGGAGNAPVQAGGAGGSNGANGTNTKNDGTRGMGGVGSGVSASPAGGGGGGGGVATNNFTGGVGGSASSILGSFTGGSGGSINNSGTLALSYSGAGGGGAGLAGNGSNAISGAGSTAVGGAGGAGGGGGGGGNIVASTSNGTGGNGGSGVVIIRYAMV